MIEKISLCLRDETDNLIEIESTDGQIQVKLDIAIADKISTINSFIQSVSDPLMRTAEKFYFCKILQNYEKELKENANG